MQNKASTDIDRKLAIYYHPLFQEIIKLIVELFKKEEKFELGLLEFVEFNLKLQKALLPTFEIENALISGLNDWVKEVAECLSYEGMVSTAGCVEVTQANLPRILDKQYEACQIQFFCPKQKYIEQLVKVSNHDAFKLLGVKINKEVFSKFMFDLCSTWCEFLDVELFSYFLVGLYIQISQGQKISDSNFRSTLHVGTIDLEFMEEFEQIKATYNRVRRKELRYYRAWCEWNYLRVNEAGERLILKLDELHPDDGRVLELAVVFERAIQIINQEITSQNVGKQDKPGGTEPDNVHPGPENKDFLILKKLSIEPPSKPEPRQRQPAKNLHLRDQRLSQSHQPAQIQMPEQQANETYHNFEIQIDEEGNMYLKQIVRMPVLGSKITPEPFSRKAQLLRHYISSKKDQCRQVSNLYTKVQNLKVRLQHNPVTDAYNYKTNPKIQARNQFYNKRKPADSLLNEMNKTIHQKKAPPPAQAHKTSVEIPVVKKQPKVSLQENKEYIHKVMAPAFLTDNANNPSYVEAKQGQVYSNNANQDKRDLKIGLPKLRNMEFRVKPMSSYHLIGKLTQDRSIINERVKSFSVSEAGVNAPKKDKLQVLKQQNKHLWQRYISEEEVRELNNYEQFYHKLQQAKKKFGIEFQSQFRLNLRPMLAYENKRYELGGVLTKEDQERFSIRMARLINKENRRNLRKLRKKKLRQYSRSFRNKNEKSLYEDVFINYHREAIKSIREQRKKYNSMVAP